MGLFVGLVIGFCLGIILYRPRRELVVIIPEPVDRTPIGCGMFLLVILAVLLVLTLVPLR